MLILRKLNLSVVLPILFFCFGAAIIQICKPGVSLVEKVNLRRVPPPPGLERFSFGYQETMADILWIRILQDIDLCENVPDGRVKGTEERGPKAACHKGWSFQMLDRITALAPPWRLPYHAGAVILSVMVDDDEGARLILEKGMAQFPSDYNLHYLAAYHYIYEVKNPQRAADALLVAAKNGGPSWFYSLAGRLLNEDGQREIAINVLKKALEEQKTEDGKARIRWRLKQILEQPAVGSK
ncbi:MAG: hypothetical protein J0L82_15595 [Deltaproteobacteria bacterium]|jgi:hypothetical protein|nr:hypothetical protein [Deltaproteobacteria bacterium]